MKNSIFLVVLVGFGLIIFSGCFPPFMQPRCAGMCEVEADLTEYQRDIIATFIGKFSGTVDDIDIYMGEQTCPFSGANFVLQVDVAGAMVCQAEDVETDCENAYSGTIPVKGTLTINDEPSISIKGRAGVRSRENGIKVDFFVHTEIAGADKGTIIPYNIEESGDDWFLGIPLGQELQAFLFESSFENQDESYTFETCLLTIESHTN